MAPPFESLASPEGALDQAFCPCHQPLRVEHEDHPSIHLAPFRHRVVVPRAGAGAVDQAGEATGFTSFGRTVEVYSNGFEVDSYVPGGRRMKLSGTSMAAPNVTNLAAKLLARDPSLKPEDVIRLIKDGAEDFGKDKPMFVINPKRSMELLEKRLAKKSG